MLLTTCWIISSCDYDNSKYPRGKDTKVYMGDGRYQILRNSIFTLDGTEVLVVPQELYSEFAENRSDDDMPVISMDNASQVLSVRTYVLFDSEEQKTIDDDVYKYCVDDSQDKIYTVGKYGYTILYYGQSYYEQHISIDELSMEDRNVFLNLDRFVELDYHKSLGYDFR